MKINPFYDAWLFLSGNTDEHRASGVGWLLVALFLALIAASIWIAIVNWRQDPAQRTNGHLATWFMRVMIGVMFYQGSIWKLPFPVAGGFAAALRPIAEYAAFGFHRWIAQNIFIPLLPVLDPITYFLELRSGSPSSSAFWCGRWRQSRYCSSHSFGSASTGNRRSGRGSTYS